MSDQLLLIIQPPAPSCLTPFLFLTNPPEGEKTSLKPPFPKKETAHSQGKCHQCEWEHSPLPFPCFSLSFMHPTSSSSQHYPAPLWHMHTSSLRAPLLCHFLWLKKLYSARSSTAIVRQLKEEDAREGGKSCQLKIILICPHILNKVKNKK